MSQIVLYFLHNTSVFSFHIDVVLTLFFMAYASQITRLMGLIWGPPGSFRPQMGAMLAPWTLLSGMLWCISIHWDLPLRVHEVQHFFLSCLWISSHFNRALFSQTGIGKLSLWNTIRNILSLFTTFEIVLCLFHYNDFIMGEIVSQITSLTIVYSIVYSDADQRKHQSSASPGNGEFPAQMTSYAENVSICWRHHVAEFCVILSKA